MRTASTLIALALASVLAGCATSSTEYAKAYDRKYNALRLVEKSNPGSFVGTSAVKAAVRAPGQHP